MIISVVREKQLLSAQLERLAGATPLSPLEQGRERWLEARKDLVGKCVQTSPHRLHGHVPSSSIAAQGGQERGHRGEGDRGRGIGVAGRELDFDGARVLFGGGKEVGPSLGKPVRTGSVAKGIDGEDEQDAPRLKDSSSPTTGSGERNTPLLLVTC